MKTIKILSLLFAIILASCSSKKDFATGKAQLEQQGYKNIINTGHEFACCDDKDTYSTGFTCLNKKNKVVTGCFCSSNFKSVTIRFN